MPILLYLIGAIAILAVGLFTPRMPMLSIGSLVAAGLSGFLCLGLGRALEHLSAIERHTRETAEIMRKLLPDSSEEVR